METAPVIELGRAFIELVSGELPEPPAGKIWIYGTETGREVYPPDVRFVDFPDWASCLYVARPLRPFNASFSGRRERFEMCPWCRPKCGCGLRERWNPKFDDTVAQVRTAGRSSRKSSKRVQGGEPNRICFILLIRN